MECILIRITILVLLTFKINNMKKKTDFTTDGFEVLGYFLLTAIAVIVFAYVTN